MLNRLDDTSCNAYNPIKKIWELLVSLDKRYKTEDVGMKKFVVDRFLK